MADIGWISLEDAETYFDARFNNAAWAALTDPEKTAALKTAYDRLRYCNKFDIPSSPSATQKLVLADAQCEMAQYMIIHLADEERRKGLQVQGVVEAGIVKETYDKDSLGKLPIPPIVEEMLEAGGFTTEKAFGMVDIDRDENKSVDEKIDEF